MKIIHSGDWHLGKIVNEFSMIEDQRFVLKQLLKLIEEEKPDALVIAGDLYDRSIPPVEAVELLNETFHEILINLKTPILVIAGNHDSSQRLSFASSILNKNGLYIQGGVKEHITKVELRDEYGPVNFYLVPYIDPREARVLFKDEKISSHEDSMKKVIEKIKESMQDSDRNVLVGHGYVSFMSEAFNEAAAEILKDIPVQAGAIDEGKSRAGLITSESERPLSIGGTDLISANCFSDFDYTALGHLHNPQKVGSDKIRYSGSLLKYSLSEAHYNKGVTIVGMDKNGDVTARHIPLIPKRDIRVIRGPLNELINPEVYKGSNLEDYIYAVLTDEGELIDPISKLRAVYPNVMGLTRENSAEREDIKTSASSGYKNKSKLDLFIEFYEAISGRELSVDKLDIIKNVIEDMEREAV